jgi:phage terminase large subunit
MQAVPGMLPLRPADSRRIPGWRMLREYLAGRGDGLSLHISRRCSTLINSMQSLLCDPGRPEDAAGEPHALTHAPEALRYAVMSRPRPPESEATFLPFSFRRSRSLYDI